MSHIRCLRRVCKFALFSLFFASLSSCSNYEVNTVERWCEHILDEGNIAEKHAPFWAVFPSVSFSGDEIRESFVRSMNEMALQAVDQRAERMIWKEGNELHVENPSALVVVDKKEVISEWQDGVQRSIEGQSTDPADKCLYGTVTSMFDSVTIHSKEFDSLGSQVVSEDTTVIETKRQERLSNPL